jgi:hypothetical protein
MDKNKIVSDQNIFSIIEPQEALQILKILSNEDKNLAKRIEDLFVQKAHEVDVESIASDVFSDLDFLDVEDLWDRSGSTRDGYVDSGEESWRMVEEVLEPHINKMKRYHSMGMFYEEMLFCMGIVSGLNKFENESKSEFKDWAADVSDGLADNILNDWKKSCKDPKLMKAMDDFIASE